MSDPTPPKPNPLDTDPGLGIIFAVTEQLIPLFSIGSIDTRLARHMAVSAIDGYKPETRADHVNAARTIAFSMAALALLGQVAAQPMTMPEKLKIFSRANALNRSADQSERTMMQRRRYQQANPRTEHPSQVPEPPADDPDQHDADVQAAIAEAMRIYAVCTSAIAEAQSPENPRPEDTRPETTSPATRPQEPEPAAPRPTAEQTAIRYASPRPDSAQTRAAPHWQEPPPRGATQQTRPQPPG